MNIKKKIIALTAVLAIFASFAGCSDKKKESESEAGNNSSIAGEENNNAVNTDNQSDNNADDDANNNAAAPSETLSPEEQEAVMKHDLTIEPFVPNQDGVQQDAVEPAGNSNNNNNAAAGNNNSADNNTANNNSSANNNAANNNNNSANNNAYAVEDNDPGDNNADLPGKTGLQVHNGTRTTMQAWWMDISKQQDYVFNGEYLVAEFKIKDGIGDGIYPITIDWLDAANYDAQTINFTAIDGAIVVGGEAEENKFNEGDNGNQPQVMVSNVTGKAGETVKVAIHVKNNPGIVANILRFSYNSDVLEFISAGEGADFNGKFS